MGDYIRSVEHFLVQLCDFLAIFLRGNPKGLGQELYIVTKL